MHPSFSRERYRALQRLEEHHFWFRARRRLLSAVAAECVEAPLAAVLDVGSGTGFNLNRLPIYTGTKRFSLDLFASPNPAAIPAGQEWCVIRGDACRLPFSDGALDLITAFDILEHTDDSEALPEMRRVLRASGTLVLTVPALPALWSFRDEDAGHRRRYTRASLHAVLAAAGFEVVRLSYFFAALLPAMILTRALGRRMHKVRDAEEIRPGMLNNLLYAIAAADVEVSRRVRLPIGTSLLAVCRR